MTDDPQLVAERDALLAGLGVRPPWYRPFRRRLWGRRRRDILAMDVTTLGRILRDVYNSALVDQAARMNHPTFRSLTMHRDGDWVSAVYPVTKDDLP